MTFNNYDLPNRDLVVFPTPANLGQNCDQAIHFLIKKTKCGRLTLFDALGALCH